MKDEARKYASVKLVEAWDAIYDDLDSFVDDFIEMTKLEFTPAVDSMELTDTKQNINRIMNEYSVILNGVGHSDEMIDAVD